MMAHFRFAGHLLPAAHKTRIPSLVRCLLYPLACRTAYFKPSFGYMLPEVLKRLPCSHSASSEQGPRFMLTSAADGTLRLWDPVGGVPKVQRGGFSRAVPAARHGAGGFGHRVCSSLLPNPCTKA